VAGDLQRVDAGIQLVDTEALSRLRADRGITQFSAQAVSAASRSGLAWWVVSAWLLRYGNDGDKRAAVDGAVAWGVTQLLGIALKRVVRRPRPATGVGRQPQSPSLPSTHTGNAVAYAVAAGIGSPNIAAPVGALAAGIAWSRLALNRHFPTDVVAGLALGAAVGAGVATAHRFYDPHPSES
jgi:undecaprenyl-diphosphatase